MVLAVHASRPFAPLPLIDNRCVLQLAWVSGVSGEKGKDGSEKGRELRKAWYSGYFTTKAISNKWISLRNLRTREEVSMAFSETELVFLALIFILFCSTWCWEGETIPQRQRRRQKRRERGVKERHAQRLWVFLLLCPSCITIKWKVGSGEHCVTTQRTAMKPSLYLTTLLFTLLFCNKNNRPNLTWHNVGKIKIKAYKHHLLSSRTSHVYYQAARVVCLYPQFRLRDISQFF